MQLLLKNINQLVTVHSNGKSFKSGISMRDLGVIQNASVLIDNGIFQWIGLDETFAQPLREDAEIVDASSFVALPGFVDAHTHLLFAGSRENEFALRAEGKTYQEIAAQ
ncbi:MAG: imidazolonepropionase, partial [Ignavibacteriales bacterium]|nr:imidazolonepropionase [Ignavibacteriales bacterium]